MIYDSWSLCAASEGRRTEQLMAALPDSVPLDKHQALFGRLQVLASCLPLCLRVSASVCLCDRAHVFMCCFALLYAHAIVCLCAPVAEGQR